MSGGSVVRCVRVTLGVLGLVALGILTPATASAQILSPGRLASVHSELEGIRNCTSCHELGKRGIAPDRCLSCHELLQARIASGEGYHASVQSDCAECHQDHLGTDFDLLRMDESSFDHLDTGYALELSHGEVGCRDCHRPAFITDPAVVRTQTEHGVLDRTFLGLDRSCATCHEEADPHGDQFRGQACADCHDPGTWTEPRAFTHEQARFPLEGLHAQVDCADCHATNQDPVPYRPLAFGNCADCHDDPHAGGMSGACASCHSPSGWTILSTASIEGRFDHGRTAFPLLGSHATADCAACHRPGRPPTTDLIRMRYVPGSANSTYPKPVVSSCGSCHVDRHALPGSGGRWAECATCHTEARWAPSSFGVERHAASVFPLTGAHEVTPCSSCHFDEGRGHTRFILGLEESNCAFCHATESSHEDLYSDLACEDCHVTDAFDDIIFAHAGVDDGPESTACATCHLSDDPHAGQFPGVTCATCHGIETFVPVGPRFDHDRSSFPLDGAHQDVPCAACHVSEQGVTGPFTRYRPVATDCVDCHGGAS